MLATPTAPLTASTAAFTRKIYKTNVSFIVRHYEGYRNYGYGNYGQGEVQDKDESESGSSYGSHAEDTEEGKMEFLKGLIARRPFATGEQLLEDF